MKGTSSNLPINSSQCTVISSNNISIMYYNARSLIPKHDELCVIVEAHNPDMICIVETWLCADILDSEIALPGYQVYRRDRNRHGGGILIYIRDHFVCSIFSSSVSLEIITLSVCQGSSKVFVSLFYRPPNSGSQTFEDLFLYLQSLNVGSFCNYILLGDFNVDFCNHSHPFYSRLYSIFSSFCLTQIVSDPTHLGSNGTNSIIDLVATSAPSLLQSCVTIPPLANSDHLGLLLKSQWRQTRQSTVGSNRSVWLYKHADWHKAFNLIENTNWDSLLVDDVSTSWEIWMKRYMEIMSESIPQRLLPPRRNLPWLSKSLIQLMRRRNTLFSHVKRSNKRSDVEKYKRIRNRVVIQLRTAKSNFFKNLNPRSNKKFWSTVKYLNKRYNSIPVLNQGSVTANTSKEKAEMLNSFFSTCFNPAFPPLSPRNDLIASTGEVSNIEDLLCTDEEVYGLLSSLDVSKASGPDGISARMLRMTAEFIAPSVCKLFNLSLQTGRVPHRWKQSTIVPVPKVSPACTPGSFRPVSLLSVLSKVLECHVHSIVTEHLQTSYPLAESQWGFLPGKSTVTGLLSTTYNWLSTLENGGEIGAVFFDLRKAFDSIPHRVLLEKIGQTGLSSHIITWISDYLTCREQKVVVNGEESQYTPVVSGVPQGSVLGPLLFLIYVDGLARLPLLDGGQVVLYADDLLLFRTIKSREDYHQLQDDVSMIEDWVNCNYLTLNSTKCKYMVVSRKRCPSAPESLILNGAEMEKVGCFKYLGLLLSSDMSFGKHIESICSKARKITGLLYRRFKSANRNTLLQLYLSMVRPHLEYASPVWNPFMCKEIKRIEDVEKFAMRVITRRWDTGYQDLLNMVNIPSLESRRMHSSMCTLYKIVHGLCFFPPDIVLHGHNYSQRTNRELFLHQPFARTNAFYNSFVPRATNIWNSLPASLVMSSYNTFKAYVMHYI